MVVVVSDVVADDLVFAAAPFPAAVAAYAVSLEDTVVGVVASADVLVVVDVFVVGVVSGAFVVDALVCVCHCFG